MVNEAGRDEEQIKGPKNVNVLLFAKNDLMTDQIVRQLKANQFINNDIPQTPHLDTVGSIMDDKNNPVDVIIKRHNGQFTDNNQDLTALVHEMRQRIDAGEAVPSLVVLGEKKPGFGQRVASEIEEIKKHFAEAEENYQFDMSDTTGHDEKLADLKRQEDALVRLAPAAVQFSEIKDVKVLEEITDLKEMGFFYAADIDESGAVNGQGDKERNILKRASEIKNTLQEKGKTRADYVKLRRRQLENAKDAERTQTAEAAAVSPTMDRIEGDEDEDTQPSKPNAFMRLVKRITG